MPYHVIFVPSAKRAVAKLPPDIRERILRKIDELAENPRPPGVDKLSGADDLYRVRTGEFRIIYAIADRIVTVTIVRVAHRREVYR